MNNAVCYRLGDMLYIKTPMGEEAMKSVKVSSEIGWAASFMIIIMRDTKRCCLNTLPLMIAGLLELI